MQCGVVTGHFYQTISQWADCETDQSVWDVRFVGHYASGEPFRSMTALRGALPTPGDCSLYRAIR